MSGSFSSPRQGDQYKLTPERVGHLVIVKPEEFLPQFATVNGAQDAIRIDVCDLHEQNGQGEWGTVYRGALWFSRLLVPGLKGQIGELVLGRIGQGPAKPGQDPPWQLLDESDSQAIAFAEAWLAKHPEFKSSITTSPVPPPAPGEPPIPAQMVQTTGGATFASQGPPIPTYQGAPPSSGSGAQAQIAAIQQLSPEHKAALAALGFPVE